MPYGATEISQAQWLKWSIYIKCKQICRDKKKNQWLPGAEEGMKCKGHEKFFGDDKFLSFW